MKNVPIATLLLGLFFLGGLGVVVSSEFFNSDSSIGAADASANLPTDRGVESDDWSFELVNGQRLHPFDDAQTKAVVIVFAATDCPIANAYQPVLREMSDAYSSRGIQFLLVYPSLEATVGDLTKHSADFEIDLPMVLDDTLEIAKRFNAEVTPEVFVFRPGVSQPVYRGSIDDQYAAYGKKRPVAKQQFLMDAIDSVLAGEPISCPTTRPVGCFISFDEL
ncbi:MAG: redoxin domain-containing protein [Planctomycetota bacterium]